MPHRSPADRRAAAFLAGLAAVALWTLAVSYLLPPFVGRSPARLAGYALGAALCFWLGRRALRRLAGAPPPPPP